MSVSANGLEVTASGNSWKMFELPTPFTVTPPTSLKFDFSLVEESELHAICLLKVGYIQDNRNDCFFTAGLQDHSNRQGVKITPFTEVGQSKTYDILVGSYFTGEVNAIGFILDNDLNFSPGDNERTIGQR